MGLVRKWNVVFHGERYKLPLGMSWRHVVGAGFLAGIGFTMSIFITNLAFKTTPEVVNSSIMAVLLTSLFAGIIGYTWLMLCGESAKGQSLGEDKRHDLSSPT